MRVNPFTHAKFLPYKELEAFECSDRIIVGKTTFEMLKYSEEETVLINITNRLGQTIAGTIFGYHLEEDILYVPTWMFYNLDVTDNIAISVIYKVPCSKITIRPHNNEFLSISDWNEQLGSGLKYYTSLTENTVVPIIIAGNIHKFSIEGMYPYKHKTCILQTNTVLELNVVKSLELVKQEVVLKYLYNKTQNYMSVAFSCIGHKLGGNPITNNATPRSLMLEAAKRRNEKLTLE